MFDFVGSSDKRVCLSGTDKFSCTEPSVLVCYTPVYRLMMHCIAHKWVCVTKHRSTVCLKYVEKTSPWEWVALWINFLRLQRVKRASINGNRSGNTFAKNHAVELRKISIFIHTRETLSLQIQASRGAVAQRNFVLIVSFKCWLLIRSGRQMFVAKLMLRQHQNFKMPDSRPCHQSKPNAIVFSTPTGT